MASPITPLSASTSTSTFASTSTSKSSSYWSRELMFSASPHPSQLQAGRQTEVAPMCPCHDCWEYGSHALAPPRPPKAPKSPKVLSEKKSPLHFLKRFNSSKDSVASDVRPLRQPASLESAANSIHSLES